MGSRLQSHQLSNGLYVSGRPEHPKDKPPTMGSVAMPYTGGDIKKSGELGKMFDIPTDNPKSRKSGPIPNASMRTGSDSGPITNNPGARSIYSSGPVSSTTGTGILNRQKSNSGPLRHGDSIKRSSGPQSSGVTPMARQNSGPLTPMLPTTGLITSGPISSGPLNSSGALRKVSGPLDSSTLSKMHSFSIVQNQAVTKLGQGEDFSFKSTFPKLILWAVVLLFVMGFIAGGFIFGAVRNPILLMVVFAFFVIVAALYIWNTCSTMRAVMRFIAHYPDCELRTAKDGQYVKVTGVVTCGHVPLESSFQKVPRCVYTSASLYEYRGWRSKPANPQHRRFTWGLRIMESHVADFYISDFQTGLRALVKTGYGARVMPFVDDSVVVDVNPSNKEMSPEFLRWLSERNLSSDDRLMRMREGYIKEGSTVSVMGVVRRNENVLMIVPPSEPMPTGCQWARCILPASLDGIVLRCEDTSNNDVIPV